MVIFKLLFLWPTSALQFFPSLTEANLGLNSFLLMYFCLGCCIHYTGHVIFHLHLFEVQSLLSSRFKGLESAIFLFFLSLLMRSGREYVKLASFENGFLKRYTTTNCSRFASSCCLPLCFHTYLLFWSGLQKLISMELARKKRSEMPNREKVKLPGSKFLLQKLSLLHRLAELVCVIHLVCCTLYNVLKAVSLGNVGEWKEMEHSVAE